MLFRDRVLEDFLVVFEILVGMEWGVDVCCMLVRLFIVFD